MAILAKDVTGRTDPGWGVIKLFILYIHIYGHQMEIQNGDDIKDWCKDYAMIYKYADKCRELVIRREYSSGLSDRFTADFTLQISAVRESKASFNGVCTQ